MTGELASGTTKGRGLPARHVPNVRRLGVSLAFGLLHAAVLLAVALDLGYAIGPGEYAPLGVLWRYGGLVVVAAAPAWLALRYRLVLPLVALLLTTGYVVGAELTPPGPTFEDVAELEHLDEPTGITVVEDGLYVVRYMVNAAAWTVGYLFVGLVEYAARTRWSRLPAVRAPSGWLSMPAPRGRSARLASAGGLLHAVAMVWFAHRLGVPASGATGWLMYGFGAVGMWLLAAVPLYLLFRRRLVAPTALLTAFVLLDVRADFTAGVEDPHALYFWGWFVTLGVLLAVAGVEYGVRRLDGLRGPSSST